LIYLVLENDLLIYLELGDDLLIYLVVGLIICPIVLR
jgi:hypothetical protein